MPKLKTRKSVSKRFKVTKKGKIKYLPGGKRHLLSGKKASRIRCLKRARVIEDAKAIKYIKRMLPYG